MLIADITGYSIGLFIHIVATVVAFGPTFAYGVFATVAERNSPSSVPTVLRAIQKVDRLLVTPGMVILLLAGLYMLAKADISFSESWVSVGLTAIIVLFGLTHGFLAPRLREALAYAERDLSNGGELGEEYRALTRQMEIAGRAAGVIVLVAIFFMTVKP